MPKQPVLAATLPVVPLPKADLHNTCEGASALCGPVGAVVPMIAEATVEPWQAGARGGAVLFKVWLRIAFATNMAILGAAVSMADVGWTLDADRLDAAAPLRAADTVQFAAYDESSDEEGGESDVESRLKALELMARSYS